LDWIYLLETFYFYLSSNQWHCTHGAMTPWIMTFSIVGITATFSSINKTQHNALNDNTQHYFQLKWLQFYVPCWVSWQRNPLDNHFKVVILKLNIYKNAFLEEENFFVEKNNFWHSKVCLENYLSSEIFFPPLIGRRAKRHRV
jgi:hypothetical protein